LLSEGNKLVSIDVVRRLAIEDGLSCKGIAKHLNVSESTVYRRLCAVELAPKRRNASGELLVSIQEAIRQGTENYSQIARRFTMNRSSILRIAVAMAQQEEATESEVWPSDNPLEEIDFKPISFRKAIHCKTCGHMINVQPCVYCQSVAANEKRNISKD
jgi:hypothetical protein